VRCTQCGSELESGAAFCSQCGAKAPPSAPPEEAGIRGWYHRHQEAAHERDAEDNEFQAAADRVRNGDDSDEALQKLQSLRDPRHRAAAVAALVDYSNRLLADDVLTEAEEARWQAVSEALDVGMADTGDHGGHLQTRFAVARINDGRLPQLPAGRSKLMAKRGEIVYVEVPAVLLKEVVDREFRGGSRGVSIPIAKGVRYRTSGFRGHSVVVGSHLEAADNGTLSVSSTRVVFLGDRKTIETAYAKLAGVDAFDDGIRIHASNRQSAPLLKLASGAEIVVATIQHAAQDAG
jgi:hypothetical protein